MFLTENPMVFSITLALILDFLIGDPVFSLHPVRLIGRVAEQAEALVRPRLLTSSAGFLTWTIVQVITIGTGWLILVGFGAIFGRVGKIIAGSILIWSSIAIRDLAVHARRVVDALKQGDLKRAREGVGMIVGRETENLDAAGVARAATESVAESFVDSIAAPLFWAVLLGPLGTLGYRAANTMDSMFGHKTEQYLHFGRVSAKIDDWLTWIPARLAGVVCCFAGVFVGGSIQRALQVFFRDRLKHESPNSAHGEAAFAGALTVRLGGPTVYKEGTIDKPWIGEGLEPGKKLLPCDKRIIDRAIHLMIISALLWAGLLLSFRLVLKVML